jgi:hypothetical protein
VTTARSTPLAYKDLRDWIRTLEMHGELKRISEETSLGPKIAAMQTEEFFLDQRKHADRKAFLRILNRKGGEPPRREDTID